MAVYPHISKPRLPVFDLETTFSYQRKQISSLFQVNCPTTIWYQPKKQGHFDEPSMISSRTPHLSSKYSLSTVLNTSNSITSKLESTLGQPCQLDTTLHAQGKKRKKKIKNKKPGRAKVSRTRTMREESISNESSLYSKYLNLFQKPKLGFKRRSGVDYRKKLGELKNKMMRRTPNQSVLARQYSSRNVLGEFRKMRRRAGKSHPKRGKYSQDLRQVQAYKTREINSTFHGRENVIHN